MAAYGRLDLWTATACHSRLVHFAPRLPPPPPKAWPAVEPLAPQRTHATAYSHAHWVYGVWCMAWTAGDATVCALWYAGRTPTPHGPTRRGGVGPKRPGGTPSLASPHRSRPGPAYPLPRLDAWTRRRGPRPAGPARRLPLRHAGGRLDVGDALWAAMGPPAASRLAVRPRPGPTPSPGRVALESPGVSCLQLASSRAEAGAAVR